jgi:succinate dehydrogenase / fumarate reductase, cytochrome b subunit
MATAAIPREFVWRRLHSLMGLWIVLFLIEHLLTNSQAALLWGDNGKGFVDMVNALHNLPYLQAIEIFLLGVPILIHMVWGVKYLFTARANSFSRGDSQPMLKYGRNRAYTWQRITSWILLIGIIGHVAKFRFLEYPISVNQGKETVYFVRLNMDDGLYTVASRLGAHLYDNAAIEREAQDFLQRKEEMALLEAASTLRKENLNPVEGVSPVPYSNQKEIILNAAQRYEQKTAWLAALMKMDQVVAESTNFGTATLLTVRDVFKSPIYVGLYTIFVLAACFHAMNGFWTFLITWGLVLRRAAQKSWVTVSIVIMAILIFLGLSAVWGTFWLNLRY